MTHRVQFGEGKYDDVVEQLRLATNAKHVLGIVIDGKHGHGFSVHLAGRTHSERLYNTKAMVNALAQVAKALVEAVERMEQMTPEQVRQASADETELRDALELEPVRCANCGYDTFVCTQPPDARKHVAMHCATCGARS